MAVFTLEAVFAKHGDALMLHYGPWDAPERILIDGGPRGVYRAYLEPRFRQLREEFQLEDDEALSFELVMVSHIDDDHVAGIIDTFEAVDDAKATHQPMPYAPGRLWHNSFDDILGNANKEIVSRMAATAASASDPLGLPLPKMSRESKAVVATTGQGRTLRNLAKKLRVRVNTPFKGLVMAPAARTVAFDHGLSFTVVAPSRARVEDYRKQWDKDLKAILKKEKDAASALAFTDDSPFNLASICVLAEMDGRRMLLTGDARGDYIIEGLENAGRLKPNKSLHVDLLKLPHHGSDRNVETSFFERITADHYVVSGNGEYGNPDRATLEMIRDARGDDEYAIHFTFTEDAHTKEKNAKRKAALRKVADWVKHKPDNCSVTWRDPDAEAFSIFVDLLEPLYEA
jgi:hypothetical protein